MPEISEMELLRRKLAKAEALAARKENRHLPKGNTPAQSFRLGEDHMAKLHQIAVRTGKPQVEIIRDGIDREYKNLKRRTQTDI